MAKKFDVVLVRYQGSGNKQLYELPIFSNIKKNDIVLVPVETGECLADVLAATTIYDNSDNDDLNIILEATGQEMPLKRVIATYRRRDVNWEEVDAE